MNIPNHSTEGKENIEDPVSQKNLNASFMTEGSTRSASSLGSLPGGKLPIETNRTELVWGCIRVGKASIQEFVLRNKSMNRVKLQASITGSAFKILKDRSEAEPVTTLSIFLHPMEARSFLVSFLPLTIGSAADRIQFYPLDADLQTQQSKRQFLQLFGYGGHSDLEFQNISKDTAGKLWLPLGKLVNKPVINQYFIVRNRGTLAAFSSLSVCTKGVDSFLNVTVSPSHFIIKPQEYAKVTVSYIPTKDDVKYILSSTSSSDVVELGYVKVISGSEALRGRLRRLHRKTKESGMTAFPVIENLSCRVPNEQIPPDVKLLKESVAATKSLMQLLNIKEVNITIEHDLNRSILDDIIGVDETTMFQTLCQDNSMLDTTSAQTCNTCTVEPKTIILTPPVKSVDSLLIKCESTNSLQYEISAVPTNVLQIHPKEGIILPGQTSIVQISYPTSYNKNSMQENFKMIVYVDNDKFEVDVKVIFIEELKFN